MSDTHRSDGTLDDSDADGHELLAELADDFARRYRRGERPPFEEYALGYPALAEQIRELFPAILLMEQTGLGPTPTDATPAAERVGATVGRYKLLERIGEGGFGVVFRAEQQHPVRRNVALKVIKPGMDTGQVVARCEAERQALALMDHENIAKVFDAGATDTGRPYFVMELVPGIPITDYCDRNKLATGERLELFVRVCQAVQHAHTKGVIHRDLKPTNVLVMVQDGRPVPKVIDFGVAKATGRELTEQSLLTRFAQMVGTPLYMSPEQAQMGGADVDTRSDVYSLGVLLYELLTGTTPFDRKRLGAAALDEVRRIIREEEPPKPSTRLSAAAAKASSTGLGRGQALRRLGAVVRGDLDWIVMKALDKDRSRRYPTAVALAEDVERYLHDEPVSARPPSAWYRFRKLARRRKAALAVVSALAVGALLAVVALAISAVVVWRTNDNLRQSLDRERAESYYQRITVAHRELLSSNNLGNALEVLKACPAELRKWEWDYLNRFWRVEPLVIREGGAGASAAFSPDGERLASGGADGAIKIWNSRTGDLIRALPAAHTGWVFSVAFDPEGKHLASVGADRRVKVWELARDREVFARPCDDGHVLGSAYTVAFSPDGLRLAAGGDGAVKVWDWQTGTLVHALPTGAQRAPAVSFSRDGRWMASGTWQGSVTLWDAGKGGAPVRTLTEDRYPVTALAFDKDGGLIAQASFGRRVNVWSTTTGSLVHALPHAGLVACVAFSPDGSRLASGGQDKTVRVWDVASGREVLGLRGHTGTCVSVAFSPDGRRLVSSSIDGTIRVWDATPLRGDESQAIRTFPRHDNEVWRVAVSPDGRQIASGGFRMPVQVWDADTGRVSGQFVGHPFVSFDLAWHPDGGRIASAGWDGGEFGVKVWDPRTGRDSFTVRAPAELFTCAFSPDGKYLVTAGLRGVIQVWDAATGSPIGTLGTHVREIRGITFSPDGRSLASASADGAIKLWDATRLTKKQESRFSLRGRVPGQCLDVAFSPNGRLVAAGGEENTVKIWDVESGRELRTLRGHKADVYTVAFSPGDGRWVASAGEDGTVKLWDAETGELVSTFRGHEALVTSVAFSPDGRRLYSGSWDHTVKTWDLTRLRGVPQAQPSTRPAGPERRD